MPKEKKAPALSSDRVAAACPYYCSLPDDNQNESKNLVKSSVGKENNWEEIKCPICLEAPHNAVLLVCSNRTKGCRSYMCKTTSKLQSNCLGQFLKSGASKPMLLCALCRGPVKEWIDVEPAPRELMNSMPRSCFVETCEFSGTYVELEKHASTEHPSVVGRRDLQDIRTMDSDDSGFAPIVVEELNNSFVSNGSGVTGQAHNRRTAMMTVRYFAPRRLASR